MLTIKPRLYQEKILSTATKGNTLVVLPTGLGKTLVAVMLGLVRQKKGKILVMSPTKPLVEQHAKTIEEVTGIGPQVLHGSIGFDKRQKLWDTDWIVATPQTVQRDIVRGVDIGEFALVVFDEAHRATGDYAYTYIANHYMEKAKEPLILALTASPGNTDEKIQEVMSNLSIKHVEVRIESDPDVRPYIKEKTINWQAVNLTKSYSTYVGKVKNVLRRYLRALKSMGYLKSADMSRLRKSVLLKVQTGIDGDYDAMSAVAASLKAFHALELIETQSSLAYGKYLGRLKGDKTRAAKELLLALPEPPKEEHPKLDVLVHLLKSQPLPTIVFANYRDQVDYIVARLKAEGITASRFIGQKNGMTQKKQKETVQEFRNGVHTVLVSTSVGEEGIDLPSVETLIFYEPVSSAVRYIQRRGRLRKGGKVFIMITRGTREEGYYYAARAKEKKMVALLKKIKPRVSKVQKTLETFGDDDRYIVVDDREISLVKYLSNPKVQRIGVGDFILSDRVAVERKTARDFVSSIIDGRLFEQASQLKEAYERPVIFVEGYNLFSHRNIHPNAIRGALASIAIDWEIPILFTKNAKETAALLEVISKREWEGGRKPHIKVPKAATLKDHQELVVSMLPGINAILAKRLLVVFGSPINIFNAPLYDLMQVEGIGEKKASEIKKVLESKYGGETE